MANAMNLIVGIGLIVVGILMVIGTWTIDWLVPFLGIILIVLGILMLLRKVAGGFLIGIIVLVLGILMQANWIGFPEEMRQFVGIANTIVGIVLIVLGALKLLGK